MDEKKAGEHDSVSNEIQYGQGDSGMGSPQEDQKQMSVAIGKRVQDGIGLPEPGQQEINRQGKPIHLRKQRNDETEVCPHGAPIPLSLGSDESDREKEKKQDVDCNGQPLTVGVMNENLFAHDRLPWWGSDPLSKPEGNGGFPKRMIDSRRVSFKDM
jgi:hypothetical protein